VLSAEYICSQNFFIDSSINGLTICFHILKMLQQTWECGDLLVTWGRGVTHIYLLSLPKSY
jgi:hypothetical protein